MISYWFLLLFGLFANVVRGLRWGLLISSLGERFKMSNIIYAVLGNYAVNMVLPRVGEVWRCGIITKYDKIPFTKLLGTLLIDRERYDRSGIDYFVDFYFQFRLLCQFLCEEPCIAGRLSENVRFDMDLRRCSNFSGRNLVCFQI